MIVGRGNLVKDFLDQGKFSDWQENGQGEKQCITSSTLRLQGLNFSLATCGAFGNTARMDAL
jgi:hypothetical protein